MHRSGQAHGKYQIACAPVVATSSTNRCWFSKPRSIKVKPENSEDRILSDWCLLFSDIHPPLSRSPRSFPPSSAPHPRPPPSPGFRKSSRGHLSPRPELAGSPVPSPPPVLGWGKRRSLLFQVLGFGFRGPQTLPLF